MLGEFVGLPRVYLYWRITVRVLRFSKFQFDQKLEKELLDRTATKSLLILKFWRLTNQIRLLLEDKGDILYPRC